MDNSIAG
jgi:DNA-directed RNA polymerase II subunit RPB1